MGRLKLDLHDIYNEDSAVLWGGCLIVALTFLAYASALQGGYIWDDDYYVTRNLLLGHLDGLWRIWLDPMASPQYYPLTFTTFWIESHLWGFHPLGYHLVNVLLHAGNALLLWAILRRLKLPGAWWAAAIFALHPVHVESVAWVTERKNVLSGFWYLSAFLVGLRLLERAQASVPRGAFLAVAGLFLGALLSKTVTCTLPAALLFVAWGLRGRLDRRHIMMMIPLVLLGIGMGLTTAWLEQVRTGAVGRDWSLSPVERILVAGRALWFYAGKLGWPAPLTFIYPRWRLNVWSWWQWLFPVAAVAVLVVLWRLRGRIGRWPVTAVAFFMGTLVPALGFFNVYPFRYSFVADHFQYLASIGLIALAAGAASAWAQRCGIAGRRLGAVLGAAVLAVFGGLTWRQGWIYQDIETLWGDTLRKDPSSWVAYTNLGVLRSEQGRLEEAMAYHAKVMELNPDLPTGYYNLGLLLADREEFDTAATLYRKALALNPGYAEAHNNLGTVLARQGHLAEAVREFREALRLAPHFSEARSNLDRARAQGD